MYVQFVDKDYYILNNNAKELLDKDGKHKEAAEKLNTSKPIFFTESLSGSNKRYLPEDQWKDYPEHVTKKAKIETTTTTTTTTTIADETTPTTNDANAPTTTTNDANAPTTTTVATEIIPDSKPAAVDVSPNDTPVDLHWVLVTPILLRFFLLLFMTPIVLEFIRFFLLLGQELKT